MADAGTGGDVVPERLIGERIAGRFVVEKLIGTGQLSTAFLAFDDRLHRRVTVKLFHPRHQDDVQVVESQLLAAKSVARLSHEHLAMVIDRGEHEGMPLVVLEYVRGENLQERIDRYAPLAVGEVVAYGLQIARALAYAHGHQVMHGNLRPGNVLLTEDREVKIVDFGGGSYVAQLVGDPYAAPELAEVDADAPAEPSDDIYALGALVFVALTERAPVAGLDPGELQLLRPDLSPRLASVVARALSADPADRFSSMREFAAELSTLREASVASGPADTSVLGSVDQPTRAFSIDDLDVDDDTTDTDMPTAVSIPPARPRRRRPQAEPGRVRTPRETRARILAWSMVLAPLAALLIFGVMIAGERSKEQVKGEGTAAGPTRVIALAGAVSFDPPPDGDGEEHADEVPNAVDGDGTTTWQTEGYDTFDFNARQKEGVGLVLQLQEAADVREVEITTDLPGWTVEVRASDDPERTLDGWETVSETVPVENRTRIPVKLEEESTRHLLLWITKLAIDTEETNRSRARIADIRVFVAAEQGGDSTGE